MKRYASIMLIFSAISIGSLAKPHKSNSQLFLVGGGLKTCSSINKNNCNSKALDALHKLENVKQGSLYQLSEKTVQLVKKSWLPDNKSAIKNNLIAVLQQAANQQQPTTLSKTQLKKLLREYDKSQLIHQLNDHQYYTLLDLLEQPVINKKTGQRLKEQVDLANSLNVFSTEIYQQFVERAKQLSGNEKPNLLVLTASARDPFEAADFYQAVFEQAGANSQWLPLDATLNALLQMPGERQNVCQKMVTTRAKVQGSLNRELIYPDLTSKQLHACLSPQSIIKSIEQADALFINGGDQSLTLKAFINQDGSDNAFLSLIKNKLKQENFIVGGTSAGTAVMSGGIYRENAVAMITNGQSDTAIVRGAKKDILPTEGCNKSNTCHQDLLNDDLTYNSRGGLGLFHWGILDTHFSERGRQGRLAVLSQATDARFAFGVDEATALIVSDLFNQSPRLDVIGQGGVFIVDNSHATLSSNNAFNTHYITQGDSAKIANDKLQIDIAQWKNAPVEDHSISNEILDIFQNDRFQKAAQILCRINAKSLNAKDSWQDKTINIKLEKPVDAVSGYGAIQLGDKVKDYCSYKNFHFSFSVDNEG